MENYTDEMVLLARQMRLQSIQDALRAGVLDRDGCIEVLRLPLNPDEPNTKIDDSALLDDPDGTHKLETTCPACYKPIGEYLTDFWEHETPFDNIACPGCGAPLDVQGRQFVKFEIRARGA